MYDLNKEAFGAFVAALRKEKGYTQKELADLLYTTNKAVSKWETGTTIPDVSLLIPLSEALGVTVTELLNCYKISDEEPIDPQQAETMVKQVLALSGQEQRKYHPDRWKRGLQLLICAAIGLIQVGLMLCLGYSPEELSLGLSTMMLMMLLFGIYFCSFTKEKLPKYYDDNRISGFHDGFFKMNLPGVYFNNNNWPYIVRAVQLWAMIGLVASPALFFVARTFLPDLWHTAWTSIMLVISLGGLFLPVFWVGRKYEFTSEAPRTARQTRRDWAWILICLALLLVLTLLFPISGLTTTGSGFQAGWSEGNTLTSWTASYSYFQGHRQRVVNIGNTSGVLHLEISAQEGTLGLLVTDMDGQVLWKADAITSETLEIPVPGKVRLKFTGDGAKGGFSVRWREES